MDSGVITASASSAPGVEPVEAAASRGGSAYPGELATWADLARLAAEYQSAAHLLRARGRKRDPISLAPCRLAAVQSIELYLSLFLMLCGTEAKEIRALQHDLSSRLDLARQSGLVLKRRTETHLSSLSEGREYLIARYAPDLTATLSPISRLMATLDEIAKKVEAAGARQLPAGR